MKVAITTTDHEGKVFHELKTDPFVFQKSWDKVKNFEIRFNDCDYGVGDTLLLKETIYSGEQMKNGKPLEYTGRGIQSKVTDVLSGYGLSNGWVILSVEHEFFECPKK